MGDRGNIVLIQRDSDGDERCIYLYTHWRGTSLPEVVQRALGRRQRWSDDAYLGRILFSELLGTAPEDQRNWAAETGYGISVTPLDNEHPLLCVDSDAQRVWIAPYGEPWSKVRSWSFEEFLTLPVGKTPPDEGSVNPWNALVSPEEYDRIARS